jgi:hypothetical protein
MLRHVAKILETAGELDKDRAIHYLYYSGR